MVTFAALREGIRDVVKLLILVLVSYQSMKGGQPTMPIPPPIFDQAPPARPAPPMPTGDPTRATAKIAVKGAKCSATVVDIRPGPGSYFAISAGHCVEGGIQQGEITLKDGQSFSFRVVRCRRDLDLSLLQFSGPDGLPVATVAKEQPPPGTQVWHKGYGSALPSGSTLGTLTLSRVSNGMLVYRMRVVPGDSGAGIFRVDNGQLVSVVSGRRPGLCYAAGTASIWQLLQGSGDSG